MDNAQSFFETLSTAADVASLQGKPEDLYFEAKTCSRPLSNDDKDNLAVALSGFANADGGVLAYGLRAKGGDRTQPDVVTGIEPVSSLSATHAELLSLVGQVVEPPVANVQVVARAMTRGENLGFLLVYIPRSDAFLHRSRRDREFYRRHGHGFFKLEHYEIAEFYGRRKNPALKFWWGVKAASWSGQIPNRIFTVEIAVGIENVGNGIAKHPAILLRRVRGYAFGLDGSGGTGLPKMPMSQGDETMFGGGNAVVYPGTHLEVTVLSERVSVSEAMPQCRDFHIEYELLAEDAQTVKSETKIEGAQILEELRAMGVLRTD